MKIKPNNKIKKLIILKIKLKQLIKTNSKRIFIKIMMTNPNNLRIEIKSKINKNHCKKRIIKKDKILSTLVFLFLKF